MRIRLTLQILIASLFISLIPQVNAYAVGNNIYVAPSGSVGTGASCVSPGYVGGASIASAIAAAVDGDTVILCDGRFSLTSQIFINDKEVTISGQTSAENTIIDGTGSTNGLFKVISKKNVTFEKITFYRGYTTQYGGAIYLSLKPSESLSTTRHIIRNSIFAQNYSDQQGGAIWAEGDDMNTGDFPGILTIANNTFVENTAHVDAGGIVLAAVSFDPAKVIIESNKFLYNRANIRAGGALVSNFSRSTSINNIFYLNTTGGTGDAETLYGGLKLSGDILMNDLSAGQRDCRLENLSPTVVLESFTDNPYCFLFDDTEPVGLTRITRAQALALTGNFIPQSPLISGHTTGLNSVTLSLASRGTGGSAITQYAYSLDGGDFTNFPAGSSATQTILGLSGGTTYQVRLKATNAVGTSYESQPYSVSTSTPYNSSTGDGNISCSVSGYFTISSYEVTSNSSCVGEVIIPSGVTAIQGFVFENSTVTKVEIPNTVTSIGMAAFRGSTNLTAVTFASGSTLTEIGSAAFERTSISSITLPDTLTFLGNYAFWSNAVLTSIVIPSGVTAIYQNTFENTTSLTSVSLPSALTLIETEAFKGATALANLIIPSSVTTIGADSFTNTTSLSSYTYCGEVIDADLAAAGLGAKTRASCAAPVVYIPPTPVPYLKTLTTPKLNLKDGKMICTPGTYNAGYTLDGVIQGSTTALFTPSSYTFNLLFSGVAQTALTVTTASATAAWDVSVAPKASLASCSVTVSANSVTNTDRSTDNTSAVATALSAQAKATSAADAAYMAAQSANSKAYQKALVDNRAQWRKQIEASRTNYFDTIARITADGGSRKMIADKSTALKVYIAAQKKSAADYKASQPAAAAARDAANKAALDTKNSAITKANAAYGAFIESIGYGVLIP